MAEAQGVATKRGRAIGEVGSLASDFGSPEQREPPAEAVVLDVKAAEGKPTPKPHVCLNAPPIMARLGILTTIKRINPMARAANSSEADVLSFKRASVGVLGSFALLTMAMPLLLIGVSMPARASLFCELKPTRDGFVALRAGPGANTRVVERMRFDDEVMLGVRRKGAWVEVTYWRGGRFVSGTKPVGDPPTARGWMSATLLKEDSCG